MRGCEAKGISCCVSVAVTAEGDPSQVLYTKARGVLVGGSLNRPCFAARMPALMARICCVLPGCPCRQPPPPSEPPPAGSAHQRIQLCPDQCHVAKHSAQRGRWRAGCWRLCRHCCGSGGSSGSPGRCCDCAPPPLKAAHGRGSSCQGCRVARYAAQQRRGRWRWWQPGHSPN